MRAKWKEYSKIYTTILSTVFTIIAVAFLIFVCYEIHIQKDLSPVPYIWGTIGGIITAIFGFYMWRAKAKSQTDLEYEKTKQLTLFREKHPEYFTQGFVNVPGETTADEGEM